VQKNVTNFFDANLRICIIYTSYQTNPNVKYSTSQNENLAKISVWVLIYGGMMRVFKKPG